MIAVSAYSLEGLAPRDAARHLFWQGYRVSDIGRALDIHISTVTGWKNRDNWEGAPSVQRVEEVTSHRLCMLIAKPEKSAKDLEEIEMLNRVQLRNARILKFQQGGNEADLNPKIRNRNKGKKKKPRKNVVPQEAVEKLRERLMDEMFEYQKVWWRERHSLEHRIRNILKSRQIGATYYFSLEAALIAAEEGRNQLFLSASKAQAHIFKSYITKFFADVGVDVTGDPLILDNGAELHFLSTNSNTAQGRHGDLYIDEYFWIPGFENLNKLAGGMASHKKWRKTFFSTPSALNHPAYPFWTGERINRGKKKSDHISIDVSHAALRDGLLCADRQWKHIVTVEDAQAQGCDLFDIEELRFENSEEEFKNLYMCQFVDDAMSVFKLSVLQKLMVDSWVEWKDWQPPPNPRPFGNKPVWLGYDPSRTRDDASLMVVAPPDEKGGKFRILEKHSFNDMPVDKQAQQIKLACEVYHVTHIGIDTSGMGIAVYDLVKNFFPGVMKIHYSVETKNQLVMKLLDVVNNGRLEFDSGWKDLVLSLMSIQRSSTPSGKQISYHASRTSETGHADQAFALMHALINEPLTLPYSEGTTGEDIMELF